MHIPKIITNFAEKFHKQQQKTSTPQQSALNSQLSIYPNPCCDIIYLEGCEIGETINIYNINGQIVMTQNITSNTSLSIAHLSPGVYIIKINNKITKLIKK